MDDPVGVIFAFVIGYLVVGPLLFYAGVWTYELIRTWRGRS